jgi:hypothetical protein
MNEPLQIVPGTSMGFRKPFTNYDLVIFDGGLASLKGATYKSSRDDLAIDRELLGRAEGREEIRQRMARHAQERASEALADSDVAEAAGRLILSTEEITDARLSKRLGLCRLKVTLNDGRVLRWTWMPRYGPYEAVAQTLRQALGDTLTVA